jgi:hypothetical protein
MGRRNFWHLKKMQGISLEAPEEPTQESHDLLDLLDCRQILLISRNWFIMHYLVDIGVLAVTFRLW